MKTAFKMLVVAMFISLAPSWNSAARAENIGVTSGFEGYWGGLGAADQWKVNGIAGTDINRGWAHWGQNNGWVAGTANWNALYFTVLDGSFSLNTRYYCRAEAWVRSSGNVSDFYFSAVDPTRGGVVWREIGPLINNQLSDPNQYIRLSFSFDLIPNSRAPGNLAVRLGFWGNGLEAWVQVDDVSLMCSTEKVYLLGPCNERGCNG